MKTILFVCGHNAGRSQMAEAFLNRLARERGVPARALSAGTQPADAVNPAAAAVMAEAGISLEGHEPKVLSQEMVDAADRIITMGCGVDVAACPARFLVTEDWGLEDPAGRPLDEVRRIRDEIRVRVERLLAETSGEGHVS